MQVRLTWRKFGVLNAAMPSTLESALNAIATRAGYLTVQAVVNRAGAAKPVAKVLVFGLPPNRVPPEKD